MVVIVIYFKLTMSASDSRQTMVSTCSCDTIVQKSARVLEVGAWAAMKRGECSLRSRTCEALM